LIPVPWTQAIRTDPQVAYFNIYSHNQVNSPSEEAGRSCNQLSVQTSKMHILFSPLTQV